MIKQQHAIPADKQKNNSKMEKECKDVSKDDDDVLVCPGLNYGFDIYFLLIPLIYIHH